VRATTLLINLRQFAAVGRNAIGGQHFIRKAIWYFSNLRKLWA
jgi:hypothetical protein